MDQGRPKIELIKKSKVPKPEFDVCVKRIKHKKELNKTLCKYFNIITTFIQYKIEFKR